MDTQNNEKETFRLRCVFFFLRCFIAPFVRFVWIKKVDGIEKIPKSGPVIFAFNHSSYFDFIAFLSICPRNIHYLAAEKFFDSRLWRPLMLATGQIEVRRSQKDKRFVHSQVYSYLKDGHAIGIFPEGTRAPSEHLLPVFGGVSLYATAMNVPIIPVGIEGAFYVLSRHDKFPKIKKAISIHIGDTIYLENFWKHKLNKRAHRFIADMVFRKIALLANKVYPFRTHLFHKRRKKIAVFDIDGTLIDGQSQRYFLDYLRRKKVINFSYYLKTMTWFILYRFGIVSDPKKIMSHAYNFLKGKDVSDIDKLVKDFVATDLRQHCYSKGFDLVQKNKEAGREIIFLSNMPEPILSSISALYGVSLYRGTHLEILKDNKYTGKVIGDIIYGVGKIHAIYEIFSKNDFSLKDSVGYGDHISDSFFLKTLSHPVVVNPERKMFSYAKKKKWEILYFEK